VEESLTKSERETLKAVWRLTSRDGADGAARTGDLAASLHVAPATMTAIIKRLAENQLVVHTPYRGVELTEMGRRLAMRVVRRHRIVERFLADMLGYSWSEADRLAPTFEHELPREVEDRLFAVLDKPTTCPHGFPIPDADGDALPAMPTLYSLNAGDRAVVALSGSTDGAMVAFLEELGLRPGVEIEVREKHPFDGPIVLSVAGNDRTLGEKLARQILVRTPPTEVDPAPEGASGARPPAGTSREEQLA
jgi:DtxR family Mn-dependent transcriptional regulator